MSFARNTRKTILETYLGEGWLGLSTTTPDCTGNTITNFTEPANEPRYARCKLEDALAFEAYAAQGSGNAVIPGGIEAHNSKNLYVGPLKSAYTFTHFGIFAAATGGSPIYTAPLTDANGAAAPVSTPIDAVFTMEKAITSGSSTRGPALRIMMPDDD